MDTSRVRMIRDAETRDDALEARHDGARRVRAVRGDGNEAHISMSLADALLISTNS